MKKTITLLFAALLIGCATNTKKEPVEPFQPQQFGAYYVESPDFANYTGKQTTAQSIMAFQQADQDTIVIMHPENFSFDIKDAPPSDFHNYKLIAPITWRNFAVPNATHITWKAEGKVRLDMVGRGFDNNFTKLVFGIQYHPNAEAGSNFTTVTLLSASDKPLKTIKIYTAGMDSTVQYMLQYQ